MDHRVPGHEHIFGEPAHEMRRLGEIHQAEALRRATAEEIGIGTKPVFALQTPFAGLARQILLENDPLSFFDFPLLPGQRAERGNGPDDLMAHHHGNPLLAPIDLWLCSPHATRFDPEDALGRPEFRPGKFTQFRPLDAGLDGGPNRGRCLSSQSPLLPVSLIRQ